MRLKETNTSPKESPGHFPATEMPLIKLIGAANQQSPVIAYFRGVGSLLSGFVCTCKILSLLSRGGRGGGGGRAFLLEFTVINYCLHE